MTYDGANAFLDLVARKLDDNPRSRQRALGPSEVGHPCARWLVYRLAHAPKGPELPPWRQTVGIAVDELIMGWLAAEPDEWLIHKRVTGGELLEGQDISGTFDAYHIPTRTLVDLKCPGPSTMKRFRRASEDPQYRVQVHVYARGLIAAGYPVDTVAVVRLPSAGELSDAIVKREPYDESIAVKALDRARAVAGLVKSVGTLAATLMPPTEHYCHRCQYFRPTANDLSIGCPGASGAIKQDPTMGGLIVPK